MIELFITLGCVTAYLLFAWLMGRRLSGRYLD
jgi:hypothetical protein